eukprot:GILJ01007697.1.p1 GENE.GILJ01007697.1~~GILJ01007697.1.p1  ORF type:complete len:368 (+),score=47.71 GILJ01007697.1:44-1147(+)
MRQSLRLVVSRAVRVSRQTARPLLSTASIYRANVRAFTSSGPRLSAPPLHSFSEEKYSESWDPRVQILESALAHVNTLGWSADALAAGATDLGYPSVASGMFPHGAYELVEHFVRKCNARLAEDLRQQPLSTMRMTERVRLGVKLRLELITPHLQNWHQALALGGLPQNATTTAELIGHIVDEIWSQAGDKSTDINWYTKRGLLASVYVSTELFMLTDTSANRQATWEFLDRRLSDVLSVGKAAGNVGEYASAVGVGVMSIVKAVATPLSTAASNVTSPISSFMSAASPFLSGPSPFAAAKSPFAGSEVDRKVTPDSDVIQLQQEDKPILASDPSLKLVQHESSKQVTETTDSDTVVVTPNPNLNND